MPARIDDQLRRHFKSMGFDPAKVDGLMSLDEEGLKKEHIRHQVQNLEKYTEIMAEKEFFLMTQPHGRSFYIGGRMPTVRVREAVLEQQSPDGD